MRGRHIRVPRPVQAILALISMFMLSADWCAGPSGGTPLSSPAPVLHGYRCNPAEPFQPNALSDLQGYWTPQVPNSELQGVVMCVYANQALSVQVLGSCLDDRDGKLVAVCDWRPRHLRALGLAASGFDVRFPLYDSAAQARDPSYTKTLHFSLQSPSVLAVASEASGTTYIFGRGTVTNTATYSNAYWDAFALSEGGGWVNLLVAKGVQGVTFNRPLPLTTLHPTAVYTCTAGGAPTVVSDTGVAAPCNLLDPGVSPRTCNAELPGPTIGFVQSSLSSYLCVAVSGYHYFVTLALETAEDGTLRLSAYLSGPGVPSSAGSGLLTLLY